MNEPRSAQSPAEVSFLVLDAFTTHAYAGNPTGVVLDASDLEAEAMQRIARELHLSETVFAQKPADGRLPVRFFSPTRELELGGSAGLALGAAWALEGRPGAEELPAELLLDTRAGTVPVELRAHPACRVEVGLALPRPRFADFGYRVELLAGALGLESYQIPPAWPLGLAFAGAWALVVPVLTREALERARPDFASLGDLERKLGCAGTLLYTQVGERDIACRGFAPGHGVSEDPVSGAALGAAAALLIKEGALRKTPPRTQVLAAQGDGLGRPGQALVEIEEDAGGVQAVRLWGTAVLTGRGFLRRP
jgi:PhzF family phenazine biosynthesis protein